MAIQKLTTTPDPQDVLARLRKSFEESRNDQIKRDRGMVEFSKAHLKQAQATLRMWRTKKSWSRSHPCCPKCERFVPGGILYCTICGTRLVVFDLYPQKVKKTR